MKTYIRYFIREPKDSIDVLKNIVGRMEMYVNLYKSQLESCEVYVKLYNCCVDKLEDDPTNIQLQNIYDDFLVILEAIKDSYLWFNPLKTFPILSNKGKEYKFSSIDTSDLFDKEKNSDNQFDIILDRIGDALSNIN